MRDCEVIKRERNESEMLSPTIDDEVDEVAKANEASCTRHVFTM